MTHTAVLFDLDGTLLDTLEDLADSMNAVLARRGFDTHPVEAYKTFVGDGVDMLVRRTAPKSRGDAKLHGELIEEMGREYADRWANKTRPYDGVAEMLNGLSERGVKMAVLSNKPHDFTELCVGKLLAGWSFDAVQGVCDSVAKKPDPAGALRIAERLGAAPAEFLYLGDTNTDMLTAVAAGMYAVGALWGFRTADELSAHGARTLIQHPTELLALV